MGHYLSKRIKLRINCTMHGQISYSVFSAGKTRETFCISFIISFHFQTKFNQKLIYFVIIRINFRIRQTYGQTELGWKIVECIARFSTFKLVQIIAPFHIFHFMNFVNFQASNVYNGMCIDSLGNNKIGGKVGLYTCHGLGGNQVRLLNMSGNKWLIESLNKLRFLFTNADPEVNRVIIFGDSRSCSKAGTQNCIMWFNTLMSMTNCWRHSERLN
jgi:hypothetical protein